MKTFRIHQEVKLNKLTMGSLFDGIGGFVYAGNQVGIDTLWSSEIDSCCEAVTKHHLPHVSQLGDITKINGAEVPPVDIICGGSPCQDLSVAGKRAGLAGERSGLYMEQIRIIREMRAETNNTYPRYMVWENVPGALSSNKGDDFRAVLEEAARCAENGVTIPQPKKWSTVGCIVGDGWSIAWRTIDAQYFGVPQRRRRIFLVADFGSERAGEILFKPESVCWDSAESGEAGEGIAADAEGGVDGSVYNESGQGYWMPDFGCLRAEGENRPTRPGHCVVQETKCYAIDALSSNSMKSKNPNSGFHEEDYVKCLDTTDTNPSKNQGGNVIVQEVKCLNPHDSQSQRIYDASGIYPCLSSNETGGQNRQAICLQANGIDRKDENGCNGKGWADDVCYTLNTIDRHAVVFEGNDTVYALDQQGGKGQCNYAENIMVPLCADSHGTPHAVVFEPKSAFEENWAESSVKNALRAEASKSSHVVVEKTVGVFMAGQGAKARTIGYSENAAPTLKSTNSGGNTVPTCVFGVDCRNATIDEELTHTPQAKPGGGYSLNCTPLVMATGQANAEITHGISTTLLAESHEQPICVHPHDCGTIAASGAGTSRPAGQCNETDLCIVTNSQKHRKYIIRRLTPLECESLQGFPKNWTQVEYKNKPMSDSARYRMCGNSVAIPCVVRVLGGIAEIQNKNV